MRPLLTVAAGFLTATILASGAAAQELLAEQAGDQVLSERYLGTPVTVGAGDNVESVGDVSRLILDEDQRVIGVIVDVGGFLGIGAKPVGVPWDALTEEEVGGSVVLATSMTREDFEQAPAYKTLADKRAERLRQQQQQQSQYE